MNRYKKSPVHTNGTFFIETGTNYGTIIFIFFVRPSVNTVDT